MGMQGAIQEVESTNRKPALLEPGSTTGGSRSSFWRAQLNVPDEEGKIEASKVEYAPDNCG